MGFDSGKSCAMRQVGLSVILAQIGCMIPAAYARLGITDKIFTRVGAVDDVSLGQSTFQVEMAETAAILSQATSQSLVLLDEIGRGTAVADGIAIAWAVAEHMAGARFGTSEVSRVRSLETSTHEVPRTLFVTHYHELNVLTELDAVEAFRMQIVQSTSGMDDAAVGLQKKPGGSDGQEDQWLYTHRILPGPSWDSHGLAIARRAGFPTSVMSRASEVFSILRAPAGELAAHLRRSLKAADSAETVVQEAMRSEFESTSALEAPSRTGAASSDYAAGVAAGREELRRELSLFLSEHPDPRQ